MRSSMLDTVNSGFGKASCILLLLAVHMLHAPPTPLARTFGAQEDFPPPIKTLSKSERAMLEGERNKSKRTKLAVSLMNSRLRRAEELTAATAYRAAYFELGVFEGLMERTLAELLKVTRKTDRDLNDLKDFEIALRGFTPRVELLRREAPLAYEGYVAALLKSIREARAEAVKPMFGDSVVPLQERR